MEFKQLLVVGCGGFVGSVMRFAVGGWVQRLAPGSTFPFGTMSVNLAGCLLIGILGGLADFRQLLGPAQRAFLMVGLLGGFTTYSSFAYETLLLAQEGAAAKALANALLHLVLGFAAAYAGYVGVRMI